MIPPELSELPLDELLAKLTDSEWFAYQTVGVPVNQLDEWSKCQRAIMIILTRPAAERPTQ